MSGQIVFITLFLGIASGLQPVALQVTGPVETVRVVLGDREVAVLTQPPWRTIIDFGPELTPRELTAIGFDGKGIEISRATQIINLPRPTAEFEILLAGDDASLVWRHLTHAKPVATGTKLTLDGRPLALDEQLRARLPKLDRQTPHVLAAEMRFSDGFVARRELVIESERSASVGAELTPVLIRETAAKHPPSWEGCLVTKRGTPVRTAAVEKPRALVIMVRNPDPRETAQAFGMSPKAGSGWASISLRRAAQLDQGTIERVLWPVAQRYSGGGDTSVLFERTGDFSGTSAGLLYLMFLSYVGNIEGAKREFTDAVAVAGIQAITGAQRRAVIYVLSATADASSHDPGAVRRYLRSLGVPLLVWSLTGPRPDLAGSWGEVEDVSSLAKLNDAAKRLRQTLDEQRIAWVDVDPLTALQLTASGNCGIETFPTPAVSRASAR